MRWALAWPRTIAALVGITAMVGGAPFLHTNRYLGGPDAASAAVRPMLRVGARGTPANRLDIESSNLGPGDSSQRVFDVSLQTDRPLDLSMRVSVTKSSLLDRDRKQGLRIAIESCTSDWQAHSSPLRYTCALGLRTESRARALSKLKAGPPVKFAVVRNSGVLHLRVRLMLPKKASNAFQNKRSVLQFKLVSVPHAGH
jgi:spore coat-associated protein N